jgi:hypothetical protein
MLTLTRQAAVLLSAHLLLFTQVQAANNTTWTPPKLAWTTLNSNISARSNTGFAAMPDGMLFVVGGGVDGKIQHPCTNDEYIILPLCNVKENLLLRDIVCEELRRTSVFKAVIYTMH